jgi:hypothetical protein
MASKRHGECDLRGDIGRRIAARSREFDAYNEADAAPKIVLDRSGFPPGAGVIVDRSGLKVNFGQPR